MSGTLTMTSKDYPGPGLTGEAAHPCRRGKGGKVFILQAQQSLGVGPAPTPGTREVIHAEGGFCLSGVWC
jgi:hypothetical protein